MKIDKNKYPIFLLEELEDVITQLREIAKEYHNLVGEQPGARIGSEDEESQEQEQEKKKEKEYELLRFQSKQKESFLFTIDKIELESNSKGESHSIFETYVSPESDKSIDSETFDFKKGQLINSFNGWIQILERYDKIKFQDPIIEQYENEIYEVIKIVDKDAETNSFTTEQQILMLKYLDNAHIFLESKSEDYETVEIIEEVERLKNDVTGLTKSSSMRRLSTVLAKAKKQGMSLFKELMVMFKKELMKKVLTEGFESIDKLMSLLQSIN